LLRSLLRVREGPLGGHLDRTSAGPLASRGRRALLGAYWVLRQTVFKPLGGILVEREQKAASATAALAQKVSPSWPLSTPGYFSDVAATLKKFVESGQLGIFANAYWGHKAYKLPAEVNLLGVAHYLEALEWQKEIVKVHTIFGGKNPHPNYLVGGAPCSLNLNDANAINAERLAYVGTLLGQAQDFIEKVYLPDLLAVASFYKDWGAIGGGLSNMGDRLLKPAYEEAERRAFNRVYRTVRFASAALGRNCGVLGAAAFAFEQMKRARSKP
jgi:Ni,Fe-hydrogenase I large subunit